MTKEEFELNFKNKFDEIVKLLETDSIIDYYNNHNQLETLEHFNISKKTQLRKILTLLNYDFSYKKKHSLFKGKKSTRSHESYILGGKKSAETQKNNWSLKTEHEKQDWSTKQIKAHSSIETKKKMSLRAKEQHENMTDEEKEHANFLKSEAMKKWWSSLSIEQKESLLNKQKANGAGWNKETIRNTILKRYNVTNISQLDSLKSTIKDSIIKTCREKYGVDYTCQLSNCTSSLGKKYGDTKPNKNFIELLQKYSELNFTNTFGVDREFAIGHYRYDFKIKNTLIEINPSATHNSTWSIFDDTPKSKYYHKDKMQVAKNAGYHCICIWDWDNPELVVKSLLRNSSIYARECELKHVSKNEARVFLNTYHYQGFARCSILLGLYYKNELVSIMTFGKPRFNSKYSYEIIRYCSSVNVTGGAERLFKNFIKEYNPKSVVSYCDNSKFSGDTYLKLGFNLVRQGSPSKHWYNIKTNKHYTDSLIRQQGYSRIVNKIDASEDNLTTNDNRQLMIESGFVEVYDCGQSTYAIELF